MGYTMPVKFNKTNLYGCGKGDDVYTIREFKDQVEEGCLIDYDEFGYPKR